MRSLETPKSHIRAVLLVLAVVEFIPLLLLFHHAGKPPGNADAILVTKHTHTLALMHAGQVIKTYQVALGRGGTAAKTREGDNKVPEGLYQITGRNSDSSFHRALRISYPNANDVRDAQGRHAAPGGNIMLHGIPNGLGWLGPLHRTLDWTKGCIAVTDHEIDEIWNSVPNGTPIEIRP